MGSQFSNAKLLVPATNRYHKLLKFSYSGCSLVYFLLPSFDGCQHGKMRGRPGSSLIFQISLIPKPVLVLYPDQIDNARPGMYPDQCSSRYTFRKLLKRGKIFSAATLGGRHELPCLLGIFQPRPTNVNVWLVGAMICCQKGNGKFSGWCV